MNHVACALSHCISLLPHLNAQQALYNGAGRFRSTWLGSKSTRALLGMMYVNEIMFEVYVACFYSMDRGMNVHWNQGLDKKNWQWLTKRCENQEEHLIQIRMLLNLLDILLVCFPEVQHDFSPPFLQRVALILNSEVQNTQFSGWASSLCWKSSNKHAFSVLFSPHMWDFFLHFFFLSHPPWLSCIFSLVYPLIFFPLSRKTQVFCILAH